MPNILERARRAWDAFRSKTSVTSETYYGSGSYFWPNRHRFTRGNERSIMAPLLNRIAVDAARIVIKHVRTDDEGRFKEEINDGLNQVLNLEANIDQSGRAFLQDIYSSILDEGYIAIVPIDGQCNFDMNSVLSITNARVAKIVQWYPQSIDVDVYNEQTGKHETIRFPKKMCAIIQNPFYAIMNEPNSIAQRLKRKLILLDEMDERSASGKLDLIIQLPYGTRSDIRKKQAEMRRNDIEVQLAGSKYGVAYADINEKVIQLNRSLDNNLVPQIENLTKQLQDQIGVGPEILNGTANEQQQLNYMNNILEPLVSAAVNEMRRVFLTKTARSQHEDLMYFRDPFKLVPVNNIADIADKFTRNEIMSSNEIRSVVGLKPSDQPGADELRNKNLNQSSEEVVEEKPTNSTGWWSDDYDDHIEHHGILGQKWGIRRYQNKDGSLTEAGKRRYTKGDSYNITIDTVNRILSNQETRKKLIDHYSNDMILYDKRQYGSYDDSGETYESLNKKYEKNMQNWQALLEKEIGNKTLDSLTDEYWSRDDSFAEIENRICSSLFDQASSEARKKDPLFQKRSKLYRAEKYDRYDLEFAEKCDQELFDRGGQELLESYKQFLIDPKKWAADRYKR